MGGVLEQALLTTEPRRGGDPPQEGSRFGLGFADPFPCQPAAAKRQPCPGVPSSPAEPRSSQTAADVNREGVLTAPARFYDHSSLGLTSEANPLVCSDKGEPSRSDVKRKKSLQDAIIGVKGATSPRYSL